MSLIHMKFCGSSGDTPGLEICIGHRSQQEAQQAETCTYQLGQLGEVMRKIADQKVSGYPGFAPGTGSPLN